VDCTCQLIDSRYFEGEGVCVNWDLEFSVGVGCNGDCALAAVEAQNVPGTVSRDVEARGNFKDVPCSVEEVTVAGDV
jgi:hypothetical protein